MSSNRILLVIAALAAAAAAAAWLFFGGGISGGGKPALNVLLISLDTTRADHLGCYGGAGARTPRLDRLAREGVLFENCTTSAPITLPAHASLMTGTDPFVHGARTNGGFVRDEGNQTLAEILGAAGCETGAVTAAFVLHSRFGLAQGFHTYADVAPAAGAAAAPGAPGIEAIRLHNAYAERRADEVADLAIDWLERNAAARFFLFVHFFDPHTPYEPPARFRGASDRENYAGEVAFMDEQLGRVLDALERLGIEDETIVAVVGDHGEGLGEHGEETHCCFLYDTTLAVPFILRGPGLAAARRVAEQACIIDVAPSILDFLDLPAAGAMQGTSLVPVIRGEKTHRPAAYSETMIPRYDFGFSHLRSLRLDGWKYIHAPRPELYRVADDPGEKVNTAADHPEIADRMRSLLREHLARAPQAARSAASAPLDEAARKKLLQLGYLGGSGGGTGAGTELDLFEPAGQDPKDRTREIQLVNLGLLHLSESRFDEARAAFQEAAALFPSWWIPKRLMAAALSGAGQRDRAAAFLEDVVAAEPENGEAHADLAEIRAESGDREGARLHFKEAVRCRPDLIEARRWLTNDALAAGRFGDAVAHMRGAIAIEPDNATLMSRLAWALATAPDHGVRSGADALALAQRARELTRGLDPFAVLAEAAACAELGRFEDARAAAQEAARLAAKQNNRSLAAMIQRVAESFNNDKPFRAAAAPPR